MISGMISGMISVMISYVISDTIWSFFLAPQVEPFGLVAPQVEQLFQCSPYKKRIQFFNKMPSMFRGFKHPPTGANQAICSTRPQLLYVNIKKMMYIYLIKMIPDIGYDIT